MSTQMREDNGHSIVPITRKQVIQMAEESLKHWPELDGLMRGRVRRVARTAKLLSVSWEADLTVGKCGCLIGTIRHEDGLVGYIPWSQRDSDALTFAMAGVGGDFGDLASTWIDRQPFADDVIDPYEAVLEVID